MKSHPNHTVIWIRTDLINAVAKRLPPPFHRPRARTVAVVEALSRWLESVGVDAERELPKRFETPRPAAKNERVSKNGRAKIQRGRD